MDMPLGIGLILYSNSNSIVVGFPLGTVTSLVTDLSSPIAARYEFHLVEQALILKKVSNKVYGSFYLFFPQFFVVHLVLKRILLCI